MSEPATQTEQSPKTFTPAPRRTRNWRGWGIALLLALVAYVGYRLAVGAPLHPVTRRLLPAGSTVRCSLFSYGYPYLQGDVDRTVRKYGFSEDRTGRLLDDRCQPIPKRLPYNTQVSAGRRVVFWYESGHPPMRAQPHLATRQAAVLTEHPLPTGAWWPSYLTDAGAVFTYERGNLDAMQSRPPRDAAGNPVNGRYYRWVELPPAGKGYTWEQTFFCQDPDYLVLRRQPLSVPYARGAAGMKPPARPPVDPKVYLYHLPSKRVVYAAPVSFFPKKPGVTVGITVRNSAMLAPYALCTVFRQGKRFLLVPLLGAANVLERGTPAATTLGAWDTAWRSGEDGSLWYVEGNALTIAHWRQGKSRVTRRTVAHKPDARFSDLHDDYTAILFAATPVSRGYLRRMSPPLATAPGPPWAAVWGDGELIAQTETVPLLPPALRSAAEKGARLFGRTAPLPQEARRLTLYRHGRRLGTFSVRLKPIPPVTVTIGPVGAFPTTPYREHLAFTRDGRYLSWVIDAGHGLQVYAFAVPKSGWRLY